MRLVSYILALFILCSCASSKHMLEHKTVTKTKTKTETATEKITESVQDTLQGAVPIGQLTSEPVEFNFGSSATKLNLRFANGKLQYKATTKSNKKVTERTNEQQDVQNNETNNIETVTKNKGIQVPWWLSGSVLLVIIVVIEVFKRKFKIIRL